MPTYPDIARSPFIRQAGVAVAVAAGTWAIAGSIENQNQPEKVNYTRTAALVQPIGRVATIGVVSKRLETFAGGDRNFRLVDAEHHAEKHANHARIAAREITPKEFAEWSKVNVCEEGGDWHVIGVEFSGGLGISNENWDAYGGKFFAENGGEATPDEQIVIARRIRTNPPDQNGCDGSW
jgi:hypothetical protein